MTPVFQRGVIKSYWLVEINSCIAGGSGLYCPLISGNTPSRQSVLLAGTARVAWLHGVYRSCLAARPRINRL